MSPKKVIEKKDPAQRSVRSVSGTGSSRCMMWTGIHIAGLRQALGANILPVRQRHVLQLAVSIGKDMSMEIFLSDWKLSNESLVFLVFMLKSEEAIMKRLVNIVVKKRAEFWVVYLLRLETYLSKEIVLISTLLSLSLLNKDSLVRSRPIFPPLSGSTEALRSISALSESQEPKTLFRNVTTSTVPLAPVKLARSGRVFRT